jgi:hypothetical protein
MPAMKDYPCSPVCLPIAHIEINSIHNMATGDANRLPIANTAGIRRTLRRPQRLTTIQHD